MKGLVCAEQQHRHVLKDTLSLPLAFSTLNLASGVQVNNRIALCNQGHADVLLEAEEPQPESSSTVSAKAATVELFKHSLMGTRDDILRRLEKSNPGAFPLPPETTAASAEFSRKLAIPHREYPKRNFVGWLLGTCGKSKQELERRTGTTVAIR